MKNTHAKMLMFAIFTTVFIAIVYAYIYCSIEKSTNNIKEMRLAMNNERIMKERENKFLETYKQTADQWNTIRNIFITPNKLVNFIETIEYLNTLSGAKITIASIDADNLENAPVGKEGTVRVKINANGSWNSVMKALSLAENLPYKVTINNINANILADTSESAKSLPAASRNNWNLNFDLQASMVSVGTSTNILK